MVFSRGSNHRTMAAYNVGSRGRLTSATAPSVGRRECGFARVGGGFGRGCLECTWLWRRIVVRLEVVERTR